MSEASDERKNPDLLWGCFVGWIETLEKVEKKKA